jgi:hypothetical protein
MSDDSITNNKSEQKVERISENSEQGAATEKFQSEAQSALSSRDFTNRKDDTATGALPKLDLGDAKGFGGKDDDAKGFGGKGDLANGEKNGDDAKGEEIGKEPAEKDGKGDELKKEDPLAKEEEMEKEDPLGKDEMEKENPHDKDKDDDSDKGDYFDQKLGKWVNIDKDKDGYDKKAEKDFDRNDKLKDTLEKVDPTKKAEIMDKLEAQSNGKPYYSKQLDKWVHPSKGQSQGSHGSDYAAGLTGPRKRHGGR